jgi:glycosyltransferase involved in cell wall biosynthesis
MERTAFQRTLVSLSPVKEQTTRSVAKIISFADADPEQRSPRRLSRLAVLIPAWQPEEQFALLATALAGQGFGAVLLVNDGCDARYERVFERLALLPRVHVLKHAVNLGKGRALKTGMNYFLNELPGLDGLVTADADGQHKIDDIVRVAQAREGSGKTVVLGSRTFSAAVPLRSRFGNGLTRHIFAFITGVKLTDTQTGLRVFPRSMLPELMLLDGERYEYEMTVLAHTCRQRKPLEIPIETVYIDGNRSSHFDPIRDSMRIYFVLARFYLSAILAAGIDFAGFSIAFALSGNVATSIVVGRLSSLVNFALNKKFVFHNGASVTGALWRYYMLVAAIAGLSSLIILALHRFLHWNVFAAKLAADTLLSLVSFSVQRTFVFRRQEPS